jgi:phosphoribosylformylglycinamidine synthase
METKKPGDAVYIVGQTLKELGGSEYYRSKGYLGATVPKVHASQAKKTFTAVTKAIDMGFVRACHDLSEGGLAVAATEMALASSFGIELDLRKVPAEADRDDFVMFSESNSRFLLEVPEKVKDDFEASMTCKTFSEIGKVTQTPRLRFAGLNGTVVVCASLSDLRKNWKQTLSSGVQE